MGVPQSKLDKKGLTKLLIDLTGAADDLLHEMSFIVNDAIENSIAHNDYAHYSAINDAQIQRTHAVYIAQQGVMHMLKYYGDSRSAKDLLGKFNGYTNAILSLGDIILEHCSQKNFERVSRQYTNVQSIQRTGRDHLKSLIKAEKIEKDALKKAKDSIIPINISKTA